MTTYKVKVLADGTHLYENYHRYKPMADEDRVNQRRKPDDPRAVRFHGQWFLPLELLPEDQRTMPATRADEDAYAHMSKPGLCKCQVCRRPEAEKHRRRWRRDHGIH